MKRLLIITVLMLGAAAFAGDTLHVTTVRNLAATDPPPVSRAFRVYVIVGTVGKMRYTTQQIFSWGSQRFEVGKEYQVLKQDAQSLTLLMLDKKGREVKERLDVVSVEEVQ
jgi:hypothetical protein